MLLDKILIDGKLGNRIKEIFIKKNYPSEWENINKFSLENKFDKLTWVNQAYNYMFNIKKIPKCICGSDVKFRGRIDKIYNKYCSCKCLASDIQEVRMCTLKKNNIEKYGVENVFQLEDVKNKIKKTNIEKYGVENPNQCASIRNKINKTNLKKYGVENILTLPHIREKMISKSKENWNNIEWVDWFHSILISNNGGIGFASKTIKDKYVSFCVDKWGVKNAFQSEEIKEKIKQHYITKYGVENPQQVEFIHNKTIKSSFYCKRYKDTDLYYQGTYELDFLNRYYGKFKIERGKFIKYELDTSIKIYYPDFYLPEHDMTIEIKSSYFWNKQLHKNMAKYNFMISNEINYLVIMDKDYTEFNLNL